MILFCYLDKDEIDGNTSDATRIHDSPVACKAQKEDDFGVFTKQQVSEEIALPEKKADGSDSSSDSWKTVDSDDDEKVVVVNVIATRRRENIPTRSPKIRKPSNYSRSEVYSKIRNIYP